MNRERPTRTFVCGTCQKTVSQRTRNVTVCDTCRANIRRRKFKLRAVEFLGGKCQVCGYHKCMAGLDFHHKDPAAKVRAVSSLWSKSWEIISKEVEKCELLCRNCHAEFHYGLVP